MLGEWSRRGALDMESPALAYEVLPFVRVYADGSVERLKGTEEVPPDHSPHAPVASKDITLDANTGLYVRIYLPRLEIDTHKVPVVVYMHGGGFCIQSAASPHYHNYLNLLAKEANVICVSVNYRRTPEHRLPAAYDDCFSVLEWVERGLDPWIESHADLAQCFVAGDSAGGNIVHQVGIRERKWRRLRVVGAIVVHPGFGGEEIIGREGSPENQGVVRMCDDIWKFSLPEGANKDHPFANPVAPAAPSLSCLVYSRIVVFVAEKDFLKDRGVWYYEALKKAGKDAELIETEGEDHCFHLLNTDSENAALMMKQICHFIYSSSSSSSSVSLK